MATVATPMGAEPVDTLSASGSFTGKVRHIKIANAYATAIFYGDFVKLVAAGTVEKAAVTTSVAAGTDGVGVGVTSGFSTGSSTDLSSSIIVGVGATSFRSIFGAIFVAFSLPALFLSLSTDFCNVSLCSIEASISSTASSSIDSSILDPSSCDAAESCSAASAKPA